MIKSEQLSVFGSSYYLFPNVSELPGMYLCIIILHI
jgi:hypothetical protein